jgi:hypothetical protein
VRRGYLLAAYLLLAAVAALQQWTLQRPGDPYTHYNNYVIFRQSFVHLTRDQNLYTPYLSEHWDYFRYSPTFALAFGIFAWMPDLAGLLLWNGLNAAVLFGAWATLPVRDERVALAAGWYVAIEMMTALQNAQSNVLIAGLLILAFNGLERGRVALPPLAIAAATFTKLFGLAAFGLLLLYPRKRKTIGFAALWMAALALLPLVVVSPGDLMGLYRSWWSLLVADYAATGLSLMAWLRTWFGVSPPNAGVVLVGAALLAVPIAAAYRHRDFAFRLLVLCDILIWVVIFNHKAESSSYVIAMSGAALWFFSGEKTRIDVALISLAFVFTTLSPTDIFPRALSSAFFVPYAIKAVPCIMIWAKITWDIATMAKRSRPEGQL